MSGAISPLKHVLLAVLRAYGFVSPIKVVIFGPYARCRFSPTCSAYAAACLRRHPTAMAMKFIGRRIMRCHPFSSGGYDPVP
ncbi:MAG: membrane protein insertion efficiency factor YidD [Puniceicoccales bacterium]|nr:membrane protein insertion efficiency factor YidD [Puniceicoccales bacterium]